ncbi:hypothetical protein HAX54_035233 [Datura stramonium]|uniref:Uncharacterized protein n=1 Tax=Datura stramonium TaxID=4076 RepID=A0ABS8SF94_DATST|nr:hypothetical protein [Datura stramonium]
MAQSKFKPRRRGYALHTSSSLASLRLFPTSRKGESSNSLNNGCSSRGSSSTVVAGSSNRGTVLAYSAIVSALASASSAKILVMFGT